MKLKPIQLKLLWELNFNKEFEIIKVGLTNLVQHDKKNPPINYDEF